MPDRIKFGAFVPLADRPAIAAGLVPLADAGCEVEVMVPEVAPELGWDVRVSSPSRTCYFRLAMNATAAEWASFLAMALQVAREVCHPS
jgi:UDP:flavonoid glycosyltransferase YjiC (YdhE family)